MTLVVGIVLERSKYDIQGDETSLRNVSSKIRKLYIRDFSLKKPELLQGILDSPVPLP
jgi:hypothetical protein